MTRIVPSSLALIVLGIGAASAQGTPVPRLKPDPDAPPPERVARVETPTVEDIMAETQAPFALPDRAAGETVLDGELRQGGLVIGQTEPGSEVELDGIDVPVDEQGRFLLGFDRDHGDTARLTVISPDGDRDTRTLDIAEREWIESVITVEESKANPYRQEDLDKIAGDTSIKNAARSNRADAPYWAGGFEWPAEGCISSPFGRRRIVNGTPRRYHSGVDVAAPDGMSPLNYVGTPVTAPAPGIVTLAQDDMFFEGGLVFIDHGQQLESALMHMSSVDVEVGDFVVTGDRIGAVGSTGRVTGPHLHWSLKWHDRLLDPELVVEERKICTD